MRSLVFILTLFLVYTGISQQRSYHEDAMQYFGLNGTEHQYREAMDQMFELLKKQYSSQNIPNALWLELQKSKAEELTKIKSLLVSAYRSNFSHQDIKELINFYTSDTGKQMVADASQLSDQQKLKLSQFFASEVGQKVQNQSESLKMMVSEVSELWSRDLYQKVVAKLSSKGYQMPQ